MPVAGEGGALGGGFLALVALLSPLVVLPLSMPLPQTNQASLRLHSYTMARGPGPPTGSDSPCPAHRGPRISPRDLL